MGIADFFITALGPSAIVDALHKQNPYELGKELAAPVEKFLDGQFGEKKSEMIQTELEPFIIKLLKGFIDGLKIDA